MDQTNVTLVATDPVAIDQLRATAKLEGISRVVGLPDPHAGNGSCPRDASPAGDITVLSRRRRSLRAAHFLHFQTAKRTLLRPRQERFGRRA